MGTKAQEHESTVPTSARAIMANTIRHVKNFVSSRPSDASSSPPYLLHIRSSKFFILATICIAVFTDIFLYGIIVPVIPFALSNRAGVPQSQTQHWVSILLAAYGAAMLVGSPIAGWFADNSSSRRMPLLVGLLALAGATVMLCLARSVALLVVGRVLQGLSASIVWTVGLALIVDTVGQAEIGEMLGYVSFSMTLGFMVSPLIGGVVYERAGYYPVFYICFGLIALDIFLRLALIEKKIKLLWVDEPESVAEPPVHDDAVADVGVITSDKVDLEMAAQCAPERAPESSQTMSQTQTPADKSRRVPPVISLLSSRRLLAALCGAIIQATLTTAFDTVLPLFVQRVFDWGSLGAGLIFIALIIPSFTAPLVGRMSDRFGPRWLVVGGFLYAVPLWVCLRFVAYNSLNQKVLLCALLVLLGIALEIVMGPLIAEITYVVEAKERKNPGIFGANGAYAQAYGLFTMSFSAGCLIGPLWSGYIEVAAGWSTMTWTLALLSAAGSVPALIWTGGLITERNAKSGEERAIGKSALANVADAAPADRTSSEMSRNETSKVM